MKYLWYFEMYDLKKDLHDQKGLHYLAVLFGLMHYYTFFTNLLLSLHLEDIDNKEIPSCLE